MTAKKAKRPMVRETAPKYKASPTKTPGEALWDLFVSLSEEEQSAFLQKMLEDPEWREDIGDSIIIIESRDEPTRPFDEFIAELEQERRK